MSELKDLAEQAQLLELGAEVMRLRSELADWKAAYNKQHDRMNAVEKEAYGLRSQVATLEADKRTLRKDWDNDCARLRSETQRLRTQVATLEGQNERLRTQVSEWQVEVRSLRTQLAATPDLSAIEALLAVPSGATNGRVWHNHGWTDWRVALAAALAQVRASQPKGVDLAGFEAILVDWETNGFDETIGNWLLRPFVDFLNDLRTWLEAQPGHKALDLARKGGTP